jgi:hypothetical protein
MSIPAIVGLNLEDTFVLAWHRAADALTFHVVASLLPEHPEFSAPPEHEWACYRAGMIHFVGVSSVEGLLAQAFVPATTDAAGEVDYGYIDQLSSVGPEQYLISGEFGNVSLAAEGLVVVLAPRPNNSSKPTPRRGAA